MKIKRFFKFLIALIICIVAAIGIGVGAFFIFYTPSLTADVSNTVAPMTTNASGYLYGIAEDGVPSDNMCESLDISTVSAKVTDGLQHPIGDISHISSQIKNTDYNVVYLQDNYSTWYYCHSDIEQARADGTYDWQSFVKNDYLPKVKASVETLSKAPYSDKVVYCIYNECDNGIWFGESTTGDDGNVYGAYNEVGEQNFFEAWKMTYDLVKSVNKNALVGGPGFFDYNHDKMEHFMNWCVENNCVPDVIIYHELNDYSIRFWQQHVNDYRGMEITYGINKLPIIVTEYGRMCDNGMPGLMVQYITQIEMSGVYADTAYWRLANNLNDTCADSNTPNSNWWLYRWYADMQDNRVESSYIDLFHSNFENAFMKKKEEYTSFGFMGLASINEKQDKISVICGGAKGSAVVKLKNLNDTEFKHKTARVTIEESVYNGLQGAVNAPVIKKIYYTDIKNTLKIDLNNMEDCNAYHITVEAVCNSDEVNSLSDTLTDYNNDTFIKRYEFEDGKLLGNAYTYNNWYAASGGNQDVINEHDLVGGMENEGDGVSITINVPEDNSYDFNIIYGNSNDGPFDENGKQNPDDRKASSFLLTVDDNETELTFDNTIKSEFTDSMTFTYELTKGKHTVSLKHIEGTIVLDSLLVKAVEEQSYIPVIYDDDRSSDTADSYLVVVPYESYYDIYATKGSYRINGISASLNEGHNDVYLMRGLNYIDTDNTAGIVVSDTQTAGKEYNLSSENAVLSGGAELKHNDTLNVDYITGISSKGGKAEYNVNVDKSGTYAMTILYSNNEEGGYHDYNVDLIERYVTVTANGKSQNVFCRNTYSWDIYNTTTCFVELKQGNNTIELTNSGDIRFNNKTTYMPYINLITIDEITA